MVGSRLGGSSPQHFLIKQHLRRHVYIVYACGHHFNSALLFVMCWFMCCAIFHGGYMRLEQEVKTSHSNSPSWVVLFVWRCAGLKICLL